MRSTIAIMAVLMSAPVLPAQAGEATRLMAEICVTCHIPGPHAHSSIPSLDGRPAGELLSVLLAFRDGTRPATIMDRIARGYSPEQLGILAGELSRRSDGGRP